jgi:hypothetical protein
MRLRRIVIGLLCLWILGLLQTSTNLFQLEAEIQRHSEWGPTHSDYRRGRSFARSRNHSNPFLVGSFFNQSKNATEQVSRVSNTRTGTGTGTRTHNQSMVRKPHSRNRRKRAWWRLRDTNEMPLQLPMPILVMGFPKAGTSSIFTFFQRQGLKSQHWYCCKPQNDPQRGGPALMSGCMLLNLARNTSILHRCGHFELYSEMNGPRPQHVDRPTGRVGYPLDDGKIDFDGPGPRLFFPQHFNIQEIHDEYPNATWILNLRPVKTWVNSTL